MHATQYHTYLQDDISHPRDVAQPAGYIPMACLFPIKKYAIPFISIQ